MTTSTLPHVDDVAGDWLAVARPLVELGWYAPAATVARLAIEKAVEGKVEEIDAWHRVPDKPKFWQLARAIRRAGLIDDDFQRDLAFLHIDLSEVVHGSRIDSVVAKAMLARTHRELERLTFV